MGLRGPKKKSLEEAKASGARVHKPLGSFAPEQTITFNAPVKPDWLLPEASAFWDETLPQLIEMGIHKIDTALLAMLCQNVGTYIWCQRIVVTEGPIITHPNGQQYQRPEVKMGAEAEKRAKSLSEHFGLSIRARKAMNIKMKNPSPRRIDDLAQKYGFTNPSKHGF